MAMKIRLARGGSKKRPFYRIVAADSRMPRDGRYIEKLGTYNPLLPKDSEERVKIDLERVQYWMGEGAKPTDRISRMLEAAGVLEKKERNNPIKGKPSKKTLERIEEKAEKMAEAKAAPAEEAATEEAPAQEAPTEEVATEEAPAQEAPTEEAAAEEASAQEAPTEEAATEEAPAQEAPTEEAAAEEASAQEAPTEEAATEEAPAQEAPTEEAATEEETKKSE